MSILSTSVSKTDGTVWAIVDTTSLDQATLKAYQAYKEAQAMAAEAKREFEAMFRADAGTDGIRFGYNFGKLAIAQGEAPKAKVAPKATVSLDAFLSGQVNGGRRV